MENQPSLHCLLNLHEHRKPVSVFDADINMHIPHLLGVTRRQIFTSYSKIDIKRFLIGNNMRIESLGAFRKSTPPTPSIKLFIPGKPETTSKNIWYKN